MSLFSSDISDEFQVTDSYGLGLAPAHSDFSERAGASFGALIKIFRRFFFT
jgi:hypothetical protein